MKHMDPFTGKMVDTIEVSQEELNRQRQVWGVVQKRQSIALLCSGIARRVLTSPGVANVLNSTKQPTEATEVSVSRTTLGEVSGMFYDGLCIDTKAEPSQYDATVYRLNRKDTYHEGAGMRACSIGSNFAGVGFPRDGDLATRDAYPVAGVLQEDLVAIQAMLTELETLRDKYNLTTMDPRTLGEAIFITTDFDNRGGQVVYSSEL